MKPQPQVPPQQQTPQSNKFFAKFRNPKTMGTLYVSAVVSFICFLYITTVLLAWIIKMPLNFGKVIYLIVVHTSLLLFIWSFSKTIFTDPGRVPLHWGFYLDDPEHKKRRYCLVCHIFKPERCHHCSVCNRCVLNMDHHCPWINNCVGFYNRKFFILMLFYVVITTFIILCGQIKVQYVIIEETIDYFEQDIGNVDWALNFFIFMGFAADLVMFFVIIFFFKFHCTLIYSNLTTIEHLDSKRGTGPTALPGITATNYDIGFWYNFYQIFGKNWVLWPFPMFLESGKPVGDGVVWLQRHKDSMMNDNLDNASDIGGSMKKIGIGGDELRREKEERLKKSNNNQDFSTFPQSDNRKPYIPEETNQNNNKNIFYQNNNNTNNMPNKILGFSEHANQNPNNNYLNNSYNNNENINHNHNVQTNANPIVIDIDSNQPKRIFMPADNMMFDERYSQKLYSESSKPLESPYKARNYDKQDNFSSPYGLTGYSQPNPIMYYNKTYEPKNENIMNSDFPYKNKTNFDKYGYNRFDAGN